MNHKSNDHHAVFSANRLCLVGTLIAYVIVSVAALDQVLLYRSGQADFIKKGDSFELDINAESNDFLAVQHWQSQAVEPALDAKITKLVLCNQMPLNNRSVLAPHPLSSRVRPGVTLVVEMQLDKDEVTALRSITTLETPKLDAIRLRIASALKANFGLDSNYREGVSPHDIIDLSKLAVISDQSQSLLMPPFYAFDLDADKTFDLQRDISSLHLYLYAPHLQLSLLDNSNPKNLRSLLPSVQVHEQCIGVSKKGNTIVETGVVVDVNHIALKLPSNTEARVIENCQKNTDCTTRVLGSESRDSEPIRTLWPVAMAMTRWLNKIGFHRDLITQIRLLNLNDFDIDPAKCSLVLVETLSEDYYIDRDEVEGLERFQRNNHFDFFTLGIDVERPAYTSTQHVVVVTSNLKLSRDEEATYTIDYPIHLRYQMPTPMDETHRETSINLPLVYLKCNDNERIDGTCNLPPRMDQKFSLFDRNVDTKPSTSCQSVTWRPVEINHVIGPLKAFTPLGQLQHSWIGTVVTLGTTCLAVFILTCFVYKTTSNKCLDKQKDE